MKIRPSYCLVPFCTCVLPRHPDAVRVEILRVGPPCAHNDKPGAVCENCLEVRLGGGLP